MASTYTRNIGIEKPGTGDKSGTWGVTTNVNFDIIDDGINGQATISIAGSQDLTTTDGTSGSNGSHKVIILTGSPGATFELRVTPTDQQKYFVIKNETDSACRVIYKGITYSTSNGVEITSGATQAVTGDGGGASGVFKSLTPNTDLVNDVTPQLGGDLDVNGNDIVSVSNGDIDITPDGTGAVNITGTTNITGDLDVDNINIDGNTIISTNTDGNINLTPNGTGAVTITATTNVTGDLDIDNLNIDGNAVTSTNTNGDITITPNGSGSVVIDGISHPQADGTSGQVLQTNGSGQLSFASPSSAAPANIVFKNSGSGSIALPAGTEAVYIEAAGGGGGGGTRGPGNGNSSYSGSTGGDSTVTLSSPSISVRAKGGRGGNGDGSYNGPFSTGDTGGTTFTGAGGTGGAQDGNFDITGNEGRSGNMVKKFVSNSALGGKSISYSVGGGGASSGVDSAKAGAGGWVEVWYW